MTSPHSLQALTSEVALLKTRCEEVDFANRKLDEKVLSVEESLSGTHSSQEELERRVQEIHRLYHRLEADLGKSAAPSSSIDEVCLFVRCVLVRLLEGSVHARGEQKMESRETGHTHARARIHTHTEEERGEEKEEMKRFLVRPFL